MHFKENSPSADVILLNLKKVFALVIVTTAAMLLVDYIYSYIASHRTRKEFEPNLQTIYL